MFTEMEQTGIELTETDIDALEYEFQFSLPDDYKTFLLRYNGGSPVECGVKFDQEKNGISYEYIEFFYGLNRKLSISKYLDILSHRIPKGIVPIADTTRANFILLSTNRKTYGTIYFKDHEIEDSFELIDSNEKLPESIIIAANSFTEFLEKLYDPDEE